MPMGNARVAVADWSSTNVGILSEEDQKTAKDIVETKVKESDAALAKLKESRAPPPRAAKPLRGGQCNS
jgi:hypothetical protein